MLALKSYVPNGRVSTGLLAYYRGFSVWGLSRPRYWKRSERGTSMGLIGIGGGQEKGESLPDTVRREALEEAGAVVRIENRAPTVWAFGDGRHEFRDLTPALDPGEPSPILVWQTGLGWIDDDGTHRILDYIAAVYLGRFEMEPTPKAENPGLLFVTDAQLLSLLDGPRLLSDMVAEGALVKSALADDYQADSLSGGSDAALDGSVRLPNDTLLELHGSALYLARHWGDLAFEPLDAVGRETGRADRI